MELQQLFNFDNGRDVNAFLQETAIKLQLERENQQHQLQQQQEPRLNADQFAQTQFRGLQPLCYHELELQQQLSNVTPRYPSLTFEQYQRMQQGMRPNQQVLLIRP